MHVMHGRGAEYLEIFKRESNGKAKFRVSFAAIACGVAWANATAGMTRRHCKLVTGHVLPERTECIVSCVRV